MDDRPTKHATRRRNPVAFFLLAGLALLACSATAQPLVAQQPDWIWSSDIANPEPGHTLGECYFRKMFTLVRPAEAELTFRAGDEFEIFVNGQLAVRGQSYGSESKIDVGSLLVSGVNLIAAKVRHNGGDDVGFSASLRIRESNESRWRRLVTDNSWKMRADLTSDWQKTTHDDLSWLNAATVNRNTTHQQTTNAQPNTGSPEASSKAANGKKSKTAGRFEIDDEFAVESLLGPEETGSLIAMEFNEFGHLLLSREGGPLLIADPSQPKNHPARIRVYCDKVNSCQGILPLNGQVYVTALGPEGLGLYRLADTKRDGVIDQITKVLDFTGELGEHGPHGIKLGPDGMIYIVVGNGSQLDGEVAETSPYLNFYEGNLIPRYEDPGGHAAGIKAPCGTVIRMSVDGKKVERVAGGIRNAYDLVFDDQGELFIHDSDMEADEGTTWYRPTMVFHVADGSEMGWRSGWSKFPQHFLDQSPTVCETGRGSPTGAVCYQHLQFPVRYQNTVFLADWSEGRILALKKLRSGAGFVAEPEVFLSGKPLNVCDLAIGEDGAMYFCTGGRGTAGGVYRIRWKGQVPESILEFENELAHIIRHPQPDSAWARQSISDLKKQIGDQWQSSIEGVANEVRNPPKFRMRALQMMVLYGPSPSDEFLSQLAQDSDPDIRTQVARLCGLRGSDRALVLLENLLTDNHAVVRRVACESFLRLGATPNVTSLMPMLASLDRSEALAARRMLERIPTENWETQVLETDNKRVFIQGSFALLTSTPSLERTYQVLARASTWMDGFLNDQDFIDLLRVMELAFIQTDVDPQQVPGLTGRIGNEFPSGSSIINQELARLMAYLHISELDGRIIDYLESESVPLMDRVHLAMHLQSIGHQLDGDTRIAIIDCLESARLAENVGGSYSQYLQAAISDVAKSITPRQVNRVLKNGDRWPTAALAAFYLLPDKLDQDAVNAIITMDRSLQGSADPAAEQLRLGVIAILARSHGALSMEYLRELWQIEEDRRNDIVIGLAQRPHNANWAYLVSSLPILDDMTGQEVIQKLTTVPQRPSEAQHYRDVIELGYRLRANGGNDAIRLLEYWTEAKFEYPNDNWRAGLDMWSRWYAQTWPGQPTIRSSATEKLGRYSVEEVLSWLEQNGPGDPARGEHLFTTAQCAACHRFGSTGQNAGPDLTSLAQRFSMREILEATLDPSANIPDRYRSKIVLTVDGKQFSGMAVEQPDGGFVILQSNGKRIRVLGQDVDDVKDSQQSAMPDGLLDALSPTEVADLMAFLVNQSDRSASQSGETKSR